MNDKKALLLTDRVTGNGIQLWESLQSAGIPVSLVSIDYDGFLPEGAKSPFAHYCGGLEEGRTGYPRYFNRLQVPPFWEIRSDNNGGNIYDYETKRARVFFAEPKNRRCVRIVDWTDLNGKVRVSDHYDRFGDRYAQTVLNAEGKPVLKTYYDREGKEAITENYLTRNIILRREGKDYIFDNRTAFTAFYLIETGLAAERIFYNSLSYPFFVSEYLGRSGIPGNDLLFWQETVDKEIPGNMRGILNGDSPRTHKIIVQSLEAFEKLAALGAPRDKLERLGYIYDKKGENAGSANALILTNSDQVEKLDTLAKLLPQVTFYVGAITEMSQKLLSMSSFGNIVLLPGIRDEKAADLFKKCDFYLDINRNSEILDAVHQAFLHHQLILGFDETLHNKQYTAPELTFSLTRGVEAMAKTIRLSLEDRRFLESKLALQMQHAMEETPEKYVSVIN